MPKYIDADSLKEIIDNPREMDYEYGKIYPEEVMTKIDMMPAADVQEVQHGKWVFVAGRIYRCSLCNDRNPWTANYCPECGAKMDLQ